VCNKNTYRINKYFSILPNKKQTYEIENNRFQQFKRRFYWRSGRWSGRLTTRPCIGVQSGSDSWSIWSNHGDICSIFGGTPTQASGPTGPMTVVSAALVAASIQLTGSLETALGIILLTFFYGLCKLFLTDKHRRICEVFSLPFLVL
jgi:hypothetical protein